MSVVIERENRAGGVLWRWTKYAARKCFWGVGVLFFGSLAAGVFWMAFALPGEDVLMLADTVTGRALGIVSLARAAFCAVGVVLIVIMGHCAGWFDE
jgi:hypothetical protein